MQDAFDVVIIGAGVVGSAIAREFSRYALRIAVLDKELDVCCATSGRNSGVLHGGFTYAPGSLRAVCCVEGNAEFDRVAEELDVPFKRTGKLVVGFDDNDMKSLLKYQAIGKANGVPGLEIIDKRRLNELDGSAGGEFAMYSPTSGILSPFLYNVALAENAHANGVEFFFGREVNSVERVDGYYTLTTSGEPFKTRWVVNSAGLNSAKISSMLGIDGYQLGGFKGEYILLDRKAGRHINMPVYPAPGPTGGFATHATPTVDGNVLIGPDSRRVDDFEDYAATAGAMADLAVDGRKMFKYARREYFIRNFSGTRPKRIDPETGKVLDFVLETRDAAPNVINLVGIESPGLTCALPLARRAVGLFRAREPLATNPRFNPRRQGIVCFAGQTDEAKRKLIAQDSNYGEIVCRCEGVTRAEILAAIRNPLGVSTLAGVKHRTRAMMGRCQGGYCETRIVEMIMAEQGKSERDILLKAPGSNMFVGKVREHA